MGSVVQKVDRADVRIGDRRISGIEKGILVFLGIEQGDRESDADYLIEKIINLRIFEDEHGKMNHSLLDVRGEMLIISQFTLFGDCRKGRRPSFTEAEKPELAKDIYEYFINKAKKQAKGVSQGEFQAMMLVELVNNGPVTILLDSRKRF